MNSGPPQDVNHLAAQAAGGDAQAFELLVLEHQDRLFGVIQRMVGDTELALDLTQETFLRAWKGIRSFQGRSSFFTWLYRIARNQVASRARHDAARPRISRSLDASAEEEGGGHMEVVERAPGPEQENLRSEQRRLVLAAIAGLPTDFREVVILRDMDDRTYEEIAELLQIAVGTVRSRLHRARLELKERLRRVLDVAG